MTKTVDVVRSNYQHVAGRREWVALAVLALPLLLVSMDVSILYFAVPQISADLRASATQQLWIFDVYGFVLAGLLVTMGALADRLGARRVLLAGAFAFSACSLLAAYSGSPGQLIAARAVLGVAGATLMPSTLAMVRTMFHDDRQRAKAVAIWTGVMTGGVGLGPVLGGALLEHFWWGSVFLVNVPAMALLLVVGPVLLPRGEVRREASFDLPSAGLSLGAVLTTIYGIKEAAVHGLEPRWLVLVLIGWALGAVFVRRQLRHPRPLVDPTLLRNRRYAGAVAANAIATFALVGNAVFMTAYLQLVLGKSPLHAALWSLLPTLGVALATPLAAAASARVGRSPVLVAGLVVGAAGFVSLTQSDTTSLWPVLIGAGVLAAGLVTVMTMAGDVVLGSVRPDQAGTGAALSESATELGGALGIALLGSVGAAGYRTLADQRLPDGLADGPAGDSIAGAVGVAAQLPADLARQVVEVAQQAFVHGLHLVAMTGAVVLALTAVGALVAARAREQRLGTRD